MTAMAPLIGIPTHTRITRTGVPADEMRRAYAQAVVGVGGVAVLLPACGDPLAQLARLDGVLLAGGDDIDPAYYGEAPHPRLGEIDPDRDAWEMALAKACLAQGTPILGLCRGHQVLAVAGGGSLWQDLPSQFPSDVQHDSDSEAAHAVTIAAGSTLAGLLVVGALTVNSRHHQAAKSLGQEWRATAWAPDGVVEALELPGHRFAVGVQWHPEDMQAHEPQRRLLALSLIHI